MPPIQVADSAAARGLQSYSFRAMGGPNEIKLYADSEEQGKAAADAAIEAVAALERKYSRYIEDSVLSRINASAGGSAVEIDEETASLLDYADSCHVASGGLFDITSGVLRKAWDFSKARVPRRHEIQALLPLIGWEMVERQGASVRLPKAGMELDFGGIGKEYAADLAAQKLIEHGIQHGFVNLGGDLRAVGPHQDGQPWSIGLAHPREKGRVLRTIRLERGAVTTSGDYERYFELKGCRYCHILNPRTGYPVGGLQAVTVVGASCLVAGSVCTITMLLGAKQGLNFIRDSGLDYLVVKHDGAVESPRL